MAVATERVTVSFKTGVQPTGGGDSMPVYGNPISVRTLRPARDITGYDTVNDKTKQQVQYTEFPLPALRVFLDAGGQPKINRHARFQARGKTWLVERALLKSQDGEDGEELVVRAGVRV